MSKAIKQVEPRKGPRPVESTKSKTELALIEADIRRSKAVRILATVALVIVIIWFLLALFEPGLDYKFSGATTYPLDSREYLLELEALTDARVAWHTTVEPLPNGENYYAAELAAIHAAKHSVNMEAYIFQKGEVAKKFVEALTERARAGVHVNLVVDAIGSFSTPKHYFKDLRDAGGHVEWYHPMRLQNIFRSNNRTHRELMVIDGTTAFIGGSGIADHWLISKKDKPRWRDNMYRVHGDAVGGLQGTFVENWLEASGLIIAGPDYFPMAPDGVGSTPVLVINSSPGSGASTRARTLFQSLVVSAKKTIYVTTPYFLPDAAMKRELLNARKRGVDVRIIVPGSKSDHSMTRSSSRSKFGDLLLAGAKIYEYQPAMIHAKLLIIDGTWVVVGSTNFDSRSFSINDEVNMAAMDPALAQLNTQSFLNDLSQSKEVTYADWKRRPLWERFQEIFGWLIERQQ